MSKQKNNGLELMSGRKVCIFTLLAVVLLCSPLKAADLPLAKGDMIVITGDSIVGQHMWSSYMQAYLVLMYPKLDLKVVTHGRGGANLESWLDGGGDGYEEYTKTVYALEPKYVFVGASSNGSFTRERHQADMQTLIDQYVVGKSHATPIIFGDMGMASSRVYASRVGYDEADEIIAKSATPPWPYDKTYIAVTPGFQACKMFTAALDDTLTAKNHGFTDGMPVMFDLSGNPAGPAGIDGKTIYFVRDATPDTFKVSLAAGGSPVHIKSVGAGSNYVSKNWPHLRRPDFLWDPEHVYFAGHIGYCAKLIQGLGWTTTVSTATVAADTRTVTSSDHCAIGAVTANAFGGIDFTRLDDRLPWAIDEGGRAGAVFVWPELAGWQTYSLTVTGLAAGTYDVLINGIHVGDISSATLAAGWNMADLTTGPVHTKCQNVLNAIRDLHWLRRTYPFADKGPRREGVGEYLSNVSAQYAAPNRKRGKDLIDSVPAAKASMDGYHQLIWKAAQPETLTFSLRLENAGVIPGTSNPESHMAAVHVTVSH